MRRATLAALTLTALAAPAAAEDVRGRGHLSFQSADLTCAALSADHHFLGLGFKGGTIGFLELADKEKEFKVRPILAHKGPVSAVAFTPDGRWALSAGLDGTVKLWPAVAVVKASETDEGAALTRPSRSIALQTTGITSLAVAPDSKTFAAGGVDGTVRFATLEGKSAGKFAAHKGPITCLAYDSEGTHLATAGADRSAKVWSADGDNWKATATIDKQPGPVLCVAFAPDGKRLATAGGADRKPGEVKLWDPLTGKELATFAGHPETATWIAFHPKANRIVTGGRDKIVRVWDPDKGEELYTDSKHREPVRQVVFSADGLVLISASPDSLAFWAATPEPPAK